MTKLTSAANQAGAALASTPDLPLAFDRITRGEALPPMATRSLRPGEADRLKDDLRQLRTDMAQAYARAGHAAGGGADGMMAVLRRASLRKGRVRFDDAEAMAPAVAALEDAVRRGAPLQLVLPLGGGKAANPLKTGQAYLPDLSEHLAAVMLAAIADALTELHPAGAHVYMLPDAGLHSDDLGFPATEHRLHLRTLQADLQALGLAHRVSMIDTLEHLPTGYVEEVTLRAQDARTRAADDASFAAEVEAQVQSLRFSMNLRAEGLSDEAAVEVTMALANPEDPRLRPEARARAEALLARTRAVAPRYVGTNHALRSLELPRVVLTKLTGDGAHLRLTVHAKPGEPRPALVPSNALSRPGLLPMHGVGVRSVGSDKVRMGAFFHLEARMRGFREVRDEAGRVLFYEPSA